MTVLVVAPHPDDEVLGCGGSIARHVAEGDTVHVAVVTRGAAELFPPELTDQTWEEFRQAHMLLGTHQIHALDYPAPLLDTKPQHRVADDIRKIVLAVGAETVYVPHRGDLHFEHSIVYRASLVACRPGRHSPVRNLFVYETLSETDWAPPFGDDAFIPTRFVDISDFLDRKLQAMTCFASQLSAPPASRSIEAVEALARLRGATVCRAAAEAFMVVREIV